VTFKDPDPSNQVPGPEGAILGSCAAVTASPETVEEWAEFIRPDLAAGVASYIQAGRKVSQAKKALKKSNAGTFTHLVVDLLGYDLGSVERWMKIARCPVLSESANLPILPTAWTTLYTLSQISPKLASTLIPSLTARRQKRYGRWTPPISSTVSSACKIRRFA
jgi:hypothetical protein